MLNLNTVTISGRCSNPTIREEEFGGGTWAVFTVTPDQHKPLTVWCGGKMIPYVKTAISDRVRISVKARLEPFDGETRIVITAITDIG